MFFTIVEYLGITPDRLGPILLLGLFLIFYLSWKLKPIYTSITGINDTITRIKHSIIEMQTHFKRVGVDLDHKLLERMGSPLQPTDLGAQYIRESGLENVLNVHKEFLLTKLRGLLPEKYSPYDVQETARRILLELKNDAMMNPVKDYAYTHAMDADTILRVGGLWLRNDFLGEPRKTAPKEEGVT